jgi:hypothetical protein
VRIEIGHLVQQVHHLLAGGVLGEARLELAHVGVADPKVGKKDDHDPFLD